MAKDSKPTTKPVDDDKASKSTPKDEDAGDEAQNPSQLQPYPTGNPPDPEDEFEKVHGFRRDGKTKG